MSNPAMQQADAIDAGAGPSLRLTDRASQRVALLRSREGKAELMLRLSVTGGGCSGFQYNFSFDDTQHADDRLFANGPVTLIVDTVSLDLLDGSEVDYVEDMMGASFKVRNPNVTASCGCGSSFAL